ncbi:MAG: adenylate/guanylate cyclase domain-containing protein [Bacteroidota bacterium]|nr:adenylate/guanylate cyclase domain-containing protein [Bacteroidota bacterium]
MNFNFLIFIALLIPNLKVLGSNHTVIKDYKELYNLNDTNKVNDLLAESKRLEDDKQIDNAITTGLQALNIAEKINNNYIKYKTYKNLENLYNKAGKIVLYNKYKVRAALIKPKIETENQPSKQSQDNALKIQQEILEKEQLELKKKVEEIERLNKDKSISKEELEKRKLEIYKKQLEIDETKKTISSQALRINETTSLLQLTQQELENQKLSAKIFEDSLQIVKKNELLLKNEAEKQTLINYLLVLGLSGLFIILASVFRLYRIKKRTQELLLEKNNEIEEEKKRSDDLLLNILPIEVAHELKANGKSEPRYFNNATVMFTDFKDFTIVSEKITSKELVEEIDYLFRVFDMIIENNNLEKIKTIGDAYLCASGLPDPDSHNPLNVVKAAHQIVEFIESYVINRKEENRPFFNIRIGINSGPLVAGIVGAKKFAYDIWGDTVNIAARMEQNSEPGKINISGSTYDLIKNQASCLYRGKISAKNKGEIDMYYFDKFTEIQN